MSLVQEMALRAGASRRTASRTKSSSARAAQPGTPAAGGLSPTRCGLSRTAPTAAACSTLLRPLASSRASLTCSGGLSSWTRCRSQCTGPVLARDGSVHHHREARPTGSPRPCRSMRSKVSSPSRCTLKARCASCASPVRPLLTLPTWRFERLGGPPPPIILVSAVTPTIPKRVTA